MGQYMQSNLSNPTCTGREIIVGIDRVSDYTVQKHKKWSNGNVGEHSEKDYTGVGLDKIYCICRFMACTCIASLL